MVDDLDDDTRNQIVDWVEDGGTLVVTDVGSPLNPGRPSASAALAFLDPELQKRCSVPALRRVQRIDAPNAILQEVPDGGTGCFTIGGQSWLVILPHGRGNVVSLGGAGALVNARLGEADNALLAADLLAPTASDHVVVLRPRPLGEGDVGLSDLIAPAGEAGPGPAGDRLRRARPVAGPPAGSTGARAPAGAAAGVGPGGGRRRPHAAGQGPRPGRRPSCATTCAGRWPSGSGCRRPRLPRWWPTPSPPRRRRGAGPRTCWPS